MASTPRIPKREITGLYGWMLKRLSRKHLGEVPEAATSAGGADWRVSCESAIGSVNAPTLRPPVSQVAVKLTALKMRLPLAADAWTSIPWLTPGSRNSAGTVRVVWSGDKVTSRTRSSSGVVTMTS